MKNKYWQSPYPIKEDNRKLNEEIIVSVEWTGHNIFHEFRVWCKNTFNLNHRIKKISGDYIPEIIFKQDIEPKLYYGNYYGKYVYFDFGYFISTTYRLLVKKKSDAILIKTRWHEYYRRF
jgi:hypothetical protein